MDPRITLRDILLFEKLEQKSFMDFNSANAHDISVLMYVHDQSNKREYTRDFFCQFMERKINEGKAPKELGKFLRMIEKDLEYVNQFSDKVTENPHEKDDADKSDRRLTPAILRILYSGISPEWLMHQGMDILPVLTEGYALKHQDEFADKRFWTMMMMSPHVKRSSLQQLEKSLRTPEEKAGKEQVSEALNTKIAHAVFGMFKKK